MDTENALRLMLGPLMVASFLVTATASNRHAPIMPTQTQMERFSSDWSAAVDAAQPMIGQGN
jgi:hypothetical protein